jgi:hypothetical protein
MRRYYRLEVDSHARFFWSPDRTTWRIQLRGGEILELGQPMGGATAPDSTAAVDYDEIKKYFPKIPAPQPPGNTEWITHDFRVPFRWNLVRRWADAGGTSYANLIFYQWQKLGSTGRGYLTDIYYTAPFTPAPVFWASSFAHHVHLEWDRTSPANNRFTPIWRATPDFVLTRVDVASKRYDQAGAPRELVRRYHLKYTPAPSVPTFSPSKWRGAALRQWLR